MPTIEDSFTRAEWTGADWGQGDYVDGDLGAEDQLLHLLHHRIVEGNGGSAAKPRIATAVGARIHRFFSRQHAMRYLDDVGHLPCVYMFPASTSNIHELTDTDVTTVRVGCGFAFPVTDFGLVKEGRPTMATPLHWLKHAVFDANMTVTVSGSGITLATNRSIQGYTTGELLEEIGDRPYGVAQEFIVEFTECDVDRSSGKFRNIDLAGG